METISIEQQWADHLEPSEVKAELNLGSMQLTALRARHRHERGGSKGVASFELSSLHASLGTNMRRQSKSSASDDKCELASTETLISPEAPPFRDLRELDDLRRHRSIERTHELSLFVSRGKHTANAPTWPRLTWRQFVRMRSSQRTRIRLVFT